MLNADIEALYGQYGHYLYERCKRMLGNEDEAYDALQEVFVRVVKHARHSTGIALRSPG